MRLTEMWKQSPEWFQGKTVQQILAFAGDGQLRDSNETSTEFRQFLGHVPAPLIRQFAEQCLTARFPDSGFALQDLVNQVGRRLGFKVEDGQYRGRPGGVGFDGIWRSGEDAIVVEVKTTDAYRLSLETTARYRRELSKVGQINADSSSILYVVGREDTGDLEAQVRGSRHAWDIRLISVDALLRLMTLRIELEDPGILGKIRDILMPQEFTKVDGIIELVFSATEEVKKDEEEAIVNGAEEPEEEQAHKEPRTFSKSKFRDACIARLQAHLKESLVQRSYAVFSTPDETFAVSCSISREYAKKRDAGYWFAFHPRQKEILEAHEKASVAFGCGSEERIILIPFEKFTSWLDKMNRTVAESRSYWHIHVKRRGENWLMKTRQEHDDIDVTAFLILAD